MDIIAIMKRDYPDYRLIGPDGISFFWVDGMWKVTRQRGKIKTIIYHGDIFQDALDAFCAAEDLKELAPGA